MIEDKLCQYLADKNYRNIENLDDDNPIKKTFKVEDINGANWCMSKIRHNNTKINEYKALAQAEMERIQSWLDKETEQLKNSNSFFESKLEEYFWEQRQQDPKFKLSTPNGKIAVRKQQPEWNYDDDTLIAYLKNQGKNELIKVKEEVNKAELKKIAQVKDGIVITNDGEIIEGIKVTERPDKITIKLEG